MNTLLRVGTVVGLSLSLSLPPLPSLAASGLAAETPAIAGELQLARGGGRGGGGRAGAGGRSPSSGRTGFGNYSNGGSAYRGSSRPAGGFSSGSPPRSSTGSRQFQAGQGSANRQGERTDRTDIRQDNRTDRSTNRQDQRSDRVSDRTDVRRDRVDNRWDNHWSGWARPGWGYARPWSYGWYGGWSTPPWGWWGASAAAWGVTALTTAAIIDSAVDDAINDQVTYITVPNTSYELYYPSVEPAGSRGVTFVVNTGTGTLEMTADCEQGTLNGRAPATAQEAELLNAACVVAYGDG
jgi:hypothetical protein